MAIDWGAWDYGGSNGMRVGVDVSVESVVTHGEGGCNVTVEYYTENQHSYDDNQTLTFTGEIGGSIAIGNHAGTDPVKRATRTYTYVYPSSAYGPGSGPSKSFGCRISGAYNGVTPSTTHSANITDRPYGAPAAPTSVTAHRVDDQNNSITWTRHPTTGEPYTSQLIQRYVYFYATWVSLPTLSATATSYTDTGAIPNRAYAYRVRANNSVGSSGFDQTDVIWTAPATPTAVVRTSTGTDQVISWTEGVGYPQYSAQVWHAANGVWDSTPLATVPGVSSASIVSTKYTHVAPSASIRHKYRIRLVTTSGTVLYSAYSAETTETAGTTGPPSAPTNLDPASGSYDPTLPLQFSWTHNPTDGSIQSAYALQHRVVGSGTWTTVAKTPSTASTYTLVSGTYAKGQQIEWQVQTWGSDANPSPLSAIATWSTSPVVPIRYPMFLDVVSGRMQADTSVPHRIEVVQSAPTITDTASVLKTVLFDTVTENNTGASSAAVLVAGSIVIQRPGRYLVSAGLQWQSLAAGSGAAWVIQLNSLNAIASPTAQNSTTSSDGYNNATTTRVLRLVAGDSIRMQMVGPAAIGAQVVISTTSIGTYMAVDQLA